MNVEQKLSQILACTGPYGGILQIEKGPDFGVYLFDDGETKELELGSFRRESSYHMVYDPIETVEIELSSDGMTVQRAIPTSHYAESEEGCVYIDRDCQLYCSIGEREIYQDPDALNIRLESYLEILTERRPYLTNPVSVTHFSEAITPPAQGMTPEQRRLRREAIARGRFLGLEIEDIHRFAKGALPLIKIDRETRMVWRWKMTPALQETIDQAVAGSAIPFMPYYAILDTVPEAGLRRVALPYVWDTRYDDDGSGEANVWKRVRREMITDRRIPCYVINLDIPEYSEFGEVPYEMLDGMLLSLN